MKKWNLSILALLLLFAPSLSQAQYYQYRGLQSSPQEIVVDESFDEGTQQNWKTWSRYPASILTRGGKYILQSSHDSELEHWFDLPLSEYDNYELDLSIALKSSGEMLSNSYGFIFGTTEAGGRLALTMGSDGQYSLQELDSRGDAFVWQYDHAPGLVPYRFQQFVVRKIENEVTFIVDGEVIYEWMSNGISGARVGLLLSRGAEVMVDHIRVMRLSGPILPDRAPTDINLTSHEVDWESGFGHFSTENSTEIITGTISPVQQWTALWINDEIVPTKEDGSFEVELPLLEGTNSIRLNALLPEGRQIKRQLSIQLIPSPQLEFEREPIGLVTIEENDGPQYQTSGRNFLVLIGLNQYEHWNDLHNAVKDCEDVGKVLIDHYQFEPNYVIRLYNEDADRVGILETMEWLQDEMRENDNLLIYYAGHGFYDEQDQLGYWVPTDGRMDKVPDYIPNSTIHDYLATIDCQHTLLIADACFSGSLLSQSRGKVAPMEKSRWVFASGDTHERVFDGAPGTNSPFAAEMIEFLMENKFRSFYASELIENVSKDVAERVRQHPIGLPLMEAGDHGGLFPFFPQTRY